MSEMKRYRLRVTTPHGEVYLDVWAASERAAKAFGDRVTWADPATDAVTPISCNSNVDRSR